VPEDASAACSSDCVMKFFYLSLSIKGWKSLPFSLK
jgi:hypothetical protein